MRRLGLAAALCGATLLAGCSGSFSGINQTANTQPDTGSPGARLTGTVHGGQNPISGAHVYLFAAASGAAGAGQAAYGGAGLAASTSNASQSLLNATYMGHSDSLGAYVPTGSDGSFSISGDYTCTAGQQVYLYALGGDPRLGTGANPAAGLMAALGTCPAGGDFMSGTSPITSVMVNEVSTVAAAYAMAGFATDATHVGSSGTMLALTGIANAFANAANLESIGTGVALATTPAGNGTVPQAEINTLANILAACVNSNGAVTGPTNATPCYTLLTTAASTTGTPTDTATAAINIAQFPLNWGLYALVGGTPPFLPVLSSPPRDWTVGLNFASGLGNANVLAIDASGSIWIGSEFSSPSGVSVTKLSSTGDVLATVTSAETGIFDADGIAVDSLGNAWVGNPLVGDIVEIPSSGSMAGGATRYSGGALSSPVSIAFDGFGDLWSTSYYSVVEFSNSGAVLSGTNGYGDSPLIAPSGGIAIDGSGSAWVANYSGILKITRSGNVVSGIPGFFGSGGSYHTGIGIGSSGNVWLAETYNGAAVQLSNTGAGLTDLGLLINGIPEEPLDIAIDGSGNAWVTIPGANCVTGFTSSGGRVSVGACYTASSTLQSPSSVVADGSGNLWMVNAVTPRSVTEFIGAATPVITPIAAGLPATPTANGSSNLGTRP